MQRKQQGPIDQVPDEKCKTILETKDARDDKTWLITKQNNEKYA